MIELLAGKLIGNYNNKSDLKVREGYGILCGAVGIGLNICLFAGKLIAGLISGSIAITADAVNNLSDAGSSIISMIGFKLGGQRPDPEHPFGHGRVEYLSGLGVSVLIIIMAVELLKSSFGKILNPSLPETSGIVVGILIASIAVKLYMAFYNTRYGKLLDSTAMEATAKDSLSDSVSTLVVLISMAVGYFFRLPVDGYCGMIVGLLVLWTGIQSVKNTVDPLLGQPPTAEFVKSVSDIVKSDSLIIDLHDLVVHDYGPGRRMISLHAEVPYDEDILVIHDRIDNIEEKLRQELKCEAVIHMDPVVTDDEELTDIKKELKKIVKGINPVLMFHDLRMVKGESHTNVIFDIVVPFDFEIDEEEIKKKVAEGIFNYNNSYNTVILIDHSYVK